MSNMRLEPSALQGTIAVPPSKSLSHRVAIGLALAGADQFLIDRLNYCEDCEGTIEALHRLQHKQTIIDCRESASTLRFLLPISLAIGQGARFIGRGQLGQRPLYPYFPIFRQCNIEYAYAGKQPTDNLKEVGESGVLDFSVRGSLKPGCYEIDGSVSSQFISGLLFALPLLSEDSQLHLMGEIESQPYIDLTCDVLQQFGIAIERKNERTFRIKGNQTYVFHNSAGNMEGDYSQAAFFLCANYLGHHITLSNLWEESRQGDKEIIPLLQRMEHCYRAGKAFIVDGAQYPDIIPILAVTAALQPGLHTEIIHAQRLRMKECDRIQAICQEMQKLGACMEERADGMVIDGISVLQGGGTVWSHGDHRIAMCLAMASTRCNAPIDLKDWTCVKKSYPNFFKDFRSLGGVANERHLGK